MIKPALKTVRRFSFGTAVKAAVWRTFLSPGSIFMFLAVGKAFLSLKWNLKPKWQIDIRLKHFCEANQWTKSDSTWLIGRMSVAVRNVFKRLIHKELPGIKKDTRNPVLKIVKYYELLIHTQKYIQRQKKWKSKSLFSSNRKNQRLVKQCGEYTLVHSGWTWGWRVAVVS